MPTSSYMPDVEVHIAFNAGYTTPAASRTWTDVSQYVELQDRISIAFGRQDERSTAGANQLTLTLDNSDGRFTAGRAASPYSPNVKIGRPIRVRVTPPGGSTVTRFVGFIDEWPVEWEGTDAYAKATIRASSRLARLGLSTRLRSMIEEAILSSRPYGYWTLGDSASSPTAAESAANQMPPLVPAGVGAPVVFGSATGPSGDGLTAAQFAGGQYLTLAGEPSTGGTQGYAFECFFLRSGAPAATECILATWPTAGIGARTIAMNTSGQIEFQANGSVVASSAASFADGQTHHVAVRRWDGVSPTGALYVDGVQVDTVAAGIAAFYISVGGGDPSLVPFTGVIAHVAAYSSISLAGLVTAADLIGHASVTNPERTDERLGRILKWAGVAATEVTTQTGAETMTWQATDGQSVVDALRDVESTEGGVLFDGRDGNVMFHNRSNRYLKSAAATLNMAAQHVGSDYSPKLDRSTLVNDATVDNPTTEESARAVNTASQDEYGIASTSAKSVANSYDAIQQKASWLVASYAEPRSRVPSLTVDVLAHQNLIPSAQTLLGINVSDRLDVSNAPTQADSTSASYFVEGYTETIGPESYEITFNLSPTYPALGTFVLNDATRGQLDAGNLLAL